MTQAAVSPFWQAVEARYAARLAEEVARGLDPVELRIEAERAARKAETGPTSGRGASRAGIRIDRDPIYSRQRMLELWNEGLNVEGVARAMGCDRSTASLGLRELGVDTTSRQANKLRREVCSTGEHRLEGENLFVRTVRGVEVRACRACKRRRDLQTLRRRRVRENKAYHGPAPLGDIQNPQWGW